jgi:DNA-binding SARP family transcriptional activator
MQAWVDKVLSLCKGSSNMELCARAYVNCAVYYLSKGVFAEWRMLIDEMKRMIRSRRIAPLGFLVYKHTEAMCFNTSVQTQRLALRAVSEGLDAAEKAGVHVMDPFFYTQGVIAALNEEDLDGAAGFLSKLETTLDTGNRIHAAHYHYLSARYRLMCGDIPGAVSSAGRSLALAQETGVPFSEMLARLGLSHALHEAGEVEASERELASARPMVKNTGSFHFEYLFSLTDAYFKYVRKDEKAAELSLRRAMALGRRMGFATQRDFWRPDVMAFLCGKALEANIEAAYARDLVQKLRLTPPEGSVEMDTWPWPLKIYLLGGFQILIDGEPMRFRGKVQKKPLMLLKALISFGGNEVRAEQIEDALWPDADGDEARNAFDTTLHRLRKWIGHPDAFQFGSGVAEMDRKICWTDVWAFESLVENARVLENQGKSARAYDLTQRAVSLYKGILLPGEVNEPWTVSSRERLRRKFLNCVTWLGRRHEAVGEWEKAVSCYDRGLEVDDTYEEFYQRAMVCYQQLEREADARATYQRCRKVLSARLGLKPSMQTEEVRQSFR